MKAPKASQSRALEAPGRASPKSDPPVASTARRADIMQETLMTKSDTSGEATAAQGNGVLSAIIISRGNNRLNLPFTDSALKESEPEVLGPTTLSSTFPSNNVVSEGTRKQVLTDKTKLSDKNKEPVKGEKDRSEPDRRTRRGEKKAETVIHDTDSNSELSDLSDVSANEPATQKQGRSRVSPTMNSNNHALGASRSNTMHAETIANTALDLSVVLAQDQERQPSGYDTGKGKYADLYEEEKVAGARSLIWTSIRDSGFAILSPPRQDNDQDDVAHDEEGACTDYEHMPSNTTRSPNKLPTAEIQTGKIPESTAGKRRVVASSTPKRGKRSTRRPELPKKPKLTSMSTDVTCPPAFATRARTSKASKIEDRRGVMQITSPISVSALSSIVAEASSLIADAALHGKDAFYASDASFGVRSEINDGGFYDNIAGHYMSPRPAADKSLLPFSEMDVHEPELISLDTTMPANTIPAIADTARNHLLIEKTHLPTHQITHSLSTSEKSDSRIDFVLDDLLTSAMPVEVGLAESDRSEDVLRTFTNVLDVQEPTLANSFGKGKYDDQMHDIGQLDNALTTLKEPFFAGGITVSSHTVSQSAEAQPVHSNGPFTMPAYASNSLREAEQEIRSIVPYQTVSADQQKGFKPIGCDFLKPDKVTILPQTRSILAGPCMPKHDAESTYKDPSPLIKEAIPAHRDKPGKSQLHKTDK